jgi:hypothetical protein
VSPPSGSIRDSVGTQLGLIREGFPRVGHGGQVQPKPRVRRCARKLYGRGAIA